MVSLVDLRRMYRDRFGGEPRLFRAPGRVNLMGEHTDYNEGFVLPLAIDRHVFVAGGPGGGRRIRAFSISNNEEKGFDLDGPRASRGGEWLSYVEGMARSLDKKGHRLLGTNLLIGSDLPVGAGLSSSAALEMASGVALLSESARLFPRKELALLGQEAEHAYVGTHCGAMDQLCSALGVKDAALLIDCRNFQIRKIPFSLPGISIVICDSKLKHELSLSGYNDRRTECDEVTRLLKAYLPDIQSLRDVSEEDLLRHGKSLPDVLRKRARHVVTENSRTLKAADALEKADVPLLGELFAESHASLRDDFQVSCAELDALVEDASKISGHRAARMTGGGFGGSTVNLVESGEAERFSEELSKRFKDRFGQLPDVFLVSPSDGVCEL